MNNKDWSRKAQYRYEYFQLEYLYNLCQAMQNIDPDDQHIFTLEKLVRELESATVKS